MKGSKVKKNSLEKNVFQRYNTLKKMNFKFFSVLEEIIVTNTCFIDIISKIKYGSYLLVPMSKSRHHLCQVSVRVGGYFTS